MSLSKTAGSQPQCVGTPSHKDELTRLASYVNWPSAAAVRPCALSRHGFTYEGHGDTTRCVACGVVVNNWQRGDRPVDVHRTRSPSCPFVVDESGRDDDDVGTTLRQLRLNDPHASSFRTDGETATDSSTAPSQQTPPDTTSSSAVDRSRPDLARLRSESDRLSTFADWPSSAAVTSRELAAAGLFYTGLADRVQCAFCGGCLHSWSAADRPAHEHRRHFPDCSLVRDGASAGNDNSPTPVRSSCFLAVHASTFSPGAAN